MLVFVLMSQAVKAQWSQMNGGVCDITYALSPNSANTGLYAGINYGNCGANNYIQYWNGTTITNLNANAYVNGMIYAIAVSGNNVYVGGSFTTAKGVAGYNGIACWNIVSNTWSTLGSGVSGSNSSVYALTVDPVSNILYAGGEFTTVNGITANNIAAWNIGTASWSALNPGTAGVSGLPAGSGAGTAVGVYALTVCSGKVYVGGRFNTVNGATAANSIAAWNGSSWSTLSGGGQTGVSSTTVVNPANVASASWDAPVMALTNDGTNVYVGGDFNKVNNVSGCNNIAAWNTGTNTWSTLGNGFTWPAMGTTATDNTFGDQANVYALTMFNGNLIAGGDFMKAGTVGGANTNLFVAQWNGSSWSMLSSTCGSNVQSDVFALAVSNGILYAGGQFAPPPTGMYYIAQYTGAGPSISLSVPPSDTICNGGSLSITASGPATGYSWLPTTALSCTNCASPSASPAVSTIYTVSGTFGGCTATKTVSIVVNPKPSIILTAGSSNLCVGSNTTNISASGASTYTWSPSGSLSASTGTLVTASPTITTNYTVNATSAKGCTNSSNITITINPLPSLTITATSTSVCVGNSAILNASGASTYTWSPAASLSPATGASVTATPSISTVYSVSATSAAGCPGSQTFSLSVNPLPTLTVSASSLAVCAGSSSTLTASGAGTYTWSPTSTLNAINGTTVIATPTSNTDYTVTATDANGCKNKQNLSIAINPLPTLSLSATASTICAGTSSTLTASGADTYTWSPSSSLSSANGSSVIASPGNTTQYTVMATFTNTSCENQTALTINVTPTPTLTILPSPTFTICLGDSAHINVSGANTYTWSPAGYLSSTSSASVTATPTTSTIYSVHGTASGCPGTAVSATVTVNLPPDVSAHASPQHICTGASSTLTAAGSASSFTWSPAASLNTPYGTPVIASPTTTTEYTLLATGANGCVKKDSVRVTVNPTPTITISSTAPGNTQVICSGNTVQPISFNTATGVTVNWTNSNINVGIAASGTTGIASYIAPLLSTQQTATISAIATDTSTGCTSTLSNPPVFILTINPLPVFNPTDSITPGGCGGLSNGCISQVAAQFTAMQYSGRQLRGFSKRCKRLYRSKKHYVANRSRSNKPSCFRNTSKYLHRRFYFACGCPTNNTHDLFLDFLSRSSYRYLLFYSNHTSVRNFFSRIKFTRFQSMHE